MRTHYEWEIEDVKAGTRMVHRDRPTEELIVAYFMGGKKNRYFLVSLLDGCIYWGPMSKANMAKQLTLSDYERTHDHS